MAFGLARALAGEGIDCRILDPAVSRSTPARGALRRTGYVLMPVLALIALDRGDQHVCAVVKVPSVEDARRSHRERHRLVRRTKPEIALKQLRWACATGLPRGVVQTDAGYGNNSDLRTEITALD